ncbi:endonuclease NucS domain-containing protein [Salipaludibacillus daqingensis]|uniref:endonuclease NucS domain-containing protein n=1 Tax=Salipaludibacillus daqingensis TaxID=3041001 RepID=UPI00247609BE|nr:endonuclease NucS domain-containing protein [Salipaludibacillus daqingensis]
MNELALHDLLIANPYLIEEGLTFVKREVDIKGTKCDLLFLDKNGTYLYCEVKIKANEHGVGQLVKYDGLANNAEARFMLVGLSFKEGIKEGLHKKGYEYKLIEETDIQTFDLDAKTKVKVDPKIHVPLTKLESMEQQHQFILNENVKLKARMSKLKKSLEENVAAMFGYIKDQRNNTKGNSSRNVADLIDSIIKFKEVGII